MKLRRLNKTGLDLFAVYLDTLETDPSRNPPNSLLIDAATSETIAGAVEVEQRRFGSRFKAAQYLDQIFSKTGLTDVDPDTGLWAWLTLFYFAEVCPRIRGEHHPGERARYIPEATNFQRYYRHLLAGPYRIYKAHRQNPKRALVVLCQLIDKPGDVVEQFASRQELVTNGAFLEVATGLYVDPATGLQKRGVQTKNAGAARRLADVLNQFDVTWDLYATLAGELLGILPIEFDRFRAKA